jgi:hypothetical protein
LRICSDYKLGIYTTVLIHIQMYVLNIVNTFFYYSH